MTSSVDIWTREPADDVWTRGPGTESDGSSSTYSPTTTSPADVSSTTPSIIPSSTSLSSGTLRPGSIAGIVLGAIATVIIIPLLILHCIIRHRHATRQRTREALKDSIRLVSLPYPDPTNRLSQTYFPVAQTTAPPEYQKVKAQDGESRPGEGNDGSTGTVDAIIGEYGSTGPGYGNRDRGTVQRFESEGVGDAKLSQGCH